MYGFREIINWEQQILKYHLLFHIGAGFPHSVVVSNFFFGNNKYALFFECGVQSKDAHKYKVWRHTNYKYKSENKRKKYLWDYQTDRMSAFPIRQKNSVYFSTD